MSIHRVEIVSPSRLHFGLYSFGDPQARQFGGLGAMIDSPTVHLRAESSTAFHAVGPMADRVTSFARKWCEFHRCDEPPACRVQVLAVPPEHSGLGVGTQLGLSVATALNRFAELPQPTPLELAVSVGRGLRSAVGTHGFLLGGLIAERGKLPGEAFAPLDVRVEIPSAWRFVLATPRSLSGLHGTHEIQAFSQLPPVPAAVTAELIAIAREQILPAAARADFATFSEAMYHYCHRAGECFALIQGGAYNGPVLQRLVEDIRQLGVSGVGQSSWGPTLFCLLPDPTAAAAFVATMRASHSTDDLHLHIAAPCNAGASVTVE